MRQTSWPGKPGVPPDTQLEATWSPTTGWGYVW